MSSLAKQYTSPKALTRDLNKTVSGYKQMKAAAVKARAVTKVAKQLDKAIADNPALSVYLDAREKNAFTVKVDFKELGEKHRLIDMKPIFARSPYAKRKKDGGWYMIIPIRRKVYNQRKKEKALQSNYMSRRLHKQLTAADYGTINAKNLYDGRAQRESQNYPEINYEPDKRNNITKIKHGRGSRYISFRVVSDKSPASSWIMNRKHADRPYQSASTKALIQQIKAASKRQ